MIKMTLKCTRCKAGWITSGMPGQFYLDALKEFLDQHSACVDKVAAKTAEPDAQRLTKQGRLEDSTQICPCCRGTGRIHERDDIGVSSSDCAECNGTGKLRLCAARW